MAFDNPTRSKLQSLVNSARKLLSEEFQSQLQTNFGIQPTGEMAKVEDMKTLSDEERVVARKLRERIEHIVVSLEKEKAAYKIAIARVVREQAFTVLNRFIAIRMAEERGIIYKSCDKGFLSDSFRVYEKIAGSAFENQYERYKSFIYCLYDELALDLGALFDRYSPFGLLFPRQTALLKLFELINQSELSEIYKEDETVGWVYQYFNDENERKKMRDESAAPRNSRELAVRNQFFTPRYVVEFLTDNTLARIWYEMTGGKTKITDELDYFVKSPDMEILQSGNSHPEQFAMSEVERVEGQQANNDQVTNVSFPNSFVGNLNILRPPTENFGGDNDTYRPLKDPRELKMLDPACGSMHFGLYAFDLFEKIYLEAWDEYPELLKDLRLKCNNDRNAFQLQVPELILRHNIHGIDIDPRAVQIAGLSLWLRAQKSYQNQKIAPKNRPQIRKVNVVTAEPMPGEGVFLEEFCKELTPSILGNMVKDIFNYMKLAGEAGSLLKVEEEIQNIIKKYKLEYGKYLKEKEDNAGFLLGMAPEKEKELFNFKDLTDENFWHTAEVDILNALEAYASQAEGIHGYQKKLFADDAAQGFAFIELLRQKYDVVLMNPPFGVPSIAIIDYLENEYPIIKTDLYGAFIESSLYRLQNNGYTGAITSRTGFFLGSFQKWREQILLSLSEMKVMLDLGGGVLDNAMVETAAYVLEKRKPRQVLSTFFRLSDYEDKKNVLLTYLKKGSVLNRNSDIFHCSVLDFSKLPKSPFCYWIPDNILDVVINSKSFEPYWGTVLVGVQTDNDERFVRLWIEIPAKHLGSSLNDSHLDKGWITFLKGDSSSPFYLDHDLTLKWFHNGSELRAATESAPGGRVNNENIYFKPGISWALRTDFFVPHIVPAGCIPSVSRYEAIPNDNSSSNRLALVALLTAQIYDFIAKLQMEKWEQPKFIPGVIRNLPYPNIDPRVKETLEQLGFQGVYKVRLLSNTIETSRVFTQPWTTELISLSIKDSALAYYAFCNNCIKDIEQLSEILNVEVNKSFGLGTTNWLTFLKVIDSSELGNSKTETETPLHSLIKKFSQDKNKFTHGIVSWLVGILFGRWDIAYATGEKTPPELPDPFAPLPACPPGMLQGKQGLPAQPEDVPSNYPISIPWDGILVDDANHPLDIEGRIREVLDVIWKDKATNIEKEACEILGVSSLREYFRKPSLFFADHLKRYSKSRRAAPIYLPLSTRSGEYTIWIYYHRLNDQTLHKIVIDTLKPKIEETETVLSRFNSKDIKTLSAEERKEQEQLKDLLDELVEFKTELERVAKLPYKPNLNDGVEITMSPLYKLFRLPAWQKRLKEAWENLEEGNYDWAHLAYSIWPDRVKEKCKKDKSIAIAHDLENLYEEPVKEKKVVAKKKAGKKKDSKENPMLPVVNEGNE